MATDPSEVSSFGEELPQQSIRVFVQATLPKGVGLGDIDIRSQVVDKPMMLSLVSDKGVLPLSGVMIRSSFRQVLLALHFRGSCGEGDGARGGPSVEPERKSGTIKLSTKISH